jgi:hypothetical protein
MGADGNDRHPSHRHVIFRLSSSPLLTRLAVIRLDPGTRWRDRNFWRLTSVPDDANGRTSQNLLEARGIAFAEASDGVQAGPD